MRISLTQPLSENELVFVFGKKPALRGVSVQGISTDSREVEKGDLFVALQGEKEDGNAYLPAALAKGAGLCITEKSYNEKTLTVPDCEAALASLASYHLGKVSPLTVGITGSVGKTTTKDKIAAVLQTEYHVAKTEENHNNMLGVSLSVLAMPENCRVFVCEMGMNHLREIAALSSLIKPQIAVITNVGTSHIGQLGSRENIARAKLEILEGCEAGSPYFYPGEEKLLTPSCKAGVFPFPLFEGQGENCFSIPDDFATSKKIDLTVFGHTFRDLHVSGFGRHHAYAAAYAAAVAAYLQVSEENLRRGLLTESKENGRMTVFEAAGIRLLDDTYNSSPEAVISALASAKETAKGNLLAVLGDIEELGEKTEAYHFALGRAVAETAEYLFTFGEKSNAIAEGAKDAGMPITHIYTNADIGAPQITAAQVLSAVKENDTVLIKASHATRADRIVFSLINALQNKESQNE